jgi:O-antigen/teichoic acid export membrane protein
MLKKLSLKGRSVYATNAFWMLGDRIANIASAFIWSIILARRLGMSEFGSYNAITSSVAILLPIAAFGLNSLLNKLLIDTKANLLSTVLTGALLKLLSGIVCCVLVNIWFYYSSTLELTQVNFFYSLILIIHFLQVFESFNQSFSSSRIVSLCRFSTVILFLVLKITLWAYDYLDLTVALYVQALEFFVYFVCLSLISVKNYSEQFKNSGKYTFSQFQTMSKIMISGGGLLILSGVAETVNLKIDILMLTELSGLDSVSIYSVATKFSESGYFFAAAIATSFFPKIIKAKISNQAEYYEVLRGLIRKLLIVCFGVFSLTAIFAYPAIYYLYGVEYMDSYYVLIIHLFASFFVYFRAVFSKWIVAEHLLKYSLITHLFGGVVNVGLNLFLIPHYGYYGAAISTIISYSFSSYFSLLFFEEPRNYLTNIHFNIIGRLKK